jgi:hypothetical protein
MMNPIKKVEELTRDQQQQTNGGGLFDGMSSLVIEGAINVHTSHTDDDGQTESSSFGTNFGTGILSQNED